MNGSSKESKGDRQASAARGTHRKKGRGSSQRRQHNEFEHNPQVPSGSAANAEGGPTLATLDEASVLAPHYVPARLRCVNSVAAALLPAWRLLASSTEGGGLEPWERELRAALVPHPEGGDEWQRRCPLRWVPPPLVHADLYYALVNLLPTRLHHNTTDHAPPSARPLEPQTQSSNAPTNLVLDAAAVSGNNLDAATYCGGWEASLWRERSQVLQLFERYSQYGKQLQIVSIPSPDSQHVVHLQAQIELPGIADAVPPVTPGDTVVVRSLQLFLFKAGTVPNIPPIVPPLATPPTSPPPVLIPVELRCQVQAVVRQSTARISSSAAASSGSLSLATAKNPPPTTGAATTITVVHLSWTDQIWRNWMERATLYHEVGAPKKQASYNLRFVPSLAPLTRCLSALDWLRLQPPESVQALLFPTDAPALPTTDSDEDSEDDPHDKEWDDTLHPPVNAGSAPHKSPHLELNLPQRDFVRLVRRRTRHFACGAVRPPVLLTGPAGTGKTQTLLRALLGLLRRPPTPAEDKVDSHNLGSDSNCPIRILVCTPSHTAANVITSRLARHRDVLDRSNLFRLLDPTCPLANVPSEVLPFCRQRTDASTGERTVFGLPETASELLRFRVVVCTCHDAHWLYRVGLTNAQLRARRCNFQAELTRVCRDANLDVNLRGVHEPHWTHLFVDEAAQATEPETLIPLSVVVDPEPGRKVEIALVGDPRQLSPAVYSVEDTAACPFDLRRSWMERLLRRPDPALGGGRSHLLGPDLVQLHDWVELSLRGNRTLAIFLTHNFRAHPALLMLPSALFYADKLRSSYQPPSNCKWCTALRAIEGLCSAAPILSQDVQYCHDPTVPPVLRPVKQFDWPLHFRGVVGRDRAVTLTEGYTSDSWSNDDEARVAVEMVQTLLQQQGVPVDAVGVMAPFRGQVVRIRQRLRILGLGAVNVGTIEDYQSVERAVVVLSLTRATPAFVSSDVRMRVGVFGQPQRSNVALTRAEHLLLVVGHPAVMAQDAVWLQFLRFCARNGLFYGESGGSEDLLRWNPSQELVARSSVGSAPGSDEVVVGSLERALRRAGGERIRGPPLPSPS